MRATWARSGALEPLMAFFLFNPAVCKSPVIDFWGKSMRACFLLFFLLVTNGTWAGPKEDAAAAYGRGDYQEAIRLFRPLAAQGDAVAQFILGYMYSYGKGVPQDYAEALKWYRLSAAQGDAGAQSGLGVMYSHGEGVPQDYVRAHMWFNLAGAAGNLEATKNRDIVAAKMTPQQVSEAQKLARECQARQFKGCD
jgi:uncharacterized protein